MEYAYTYKHTAEIRKISQIKIVLSSLSGIILLRNIQIVGVHWFLCRMPVNAAGGTAKAARLLSS